MNTELNLEELVRLFREYEKAVVVNGSNLFTIDFLFPVITSTIIGFIVGTKELEFMYLSKVSISSYGELYEKEGNKLLIFLFPAVLTFLHM
jgi:ABC-type amino acid transport system permease subunit